MNDQPTLSPCLAQLEVIQEIDGLLEAITEDAVKRQGAKFDEVTNDDKVLGTIWNVNARKLFVLAVRLHAEALRDSAQSGMVDNDSEEQSLMHEAHRKDTLAHLVRSVFDYQVSCETNAFANAEDEEQLVRRDWVAVSRRKQDIRGGILGLLRG